MPATWSPVKGSGGRLNFWSVTGSGNYGEDCAEGARMAFDVIAEMRRTRNFGLLGWVVRDMGRDPLTGLEVGFLATIAECACSFPDNDTNETCVHGGIVDPEDAVSVGAVRGDETGPNQHAQKRAFVT